MKEAIELILQIQNLVAATKRKMTMQKLIIRNMTSREEMRQALISFIDNSKYCGKRETLADQLSKIYPTEMWNERTLNYLLGDSKNLDMAKVNQLLDFIEPDLKQTFTFNSLEDAIAEMRIKIGELERALIEAHRTEDMIDEREFSIIKSYSDYIIQKVNKFIVSTQKVVGQQI